MMDQNIHRKHTSRTEIRVSGKSAPNTAVRTSVPRRTWLSALHTKRPDRRVLRSTTTSSKARTRYD